MLLVGFASGRSWRQAGAGDGVGGYDPGVVLVLDHNTGRACRHKLADGAPALTGARPAPPARRSSVDSETQFRCGLAMIKVATAGHA